MLSKKRRDTAKSVLKPVSNKDFTGSLKNINKQISSKSKVKIKKGG